MMIKTVFRNFPTATEDCMTAEELHYTLGDKKLRKPSCQDLQPNLYLSDKYYIFNYTLEK